MGNGRGIASMILGIIATILNFAILLPLVLIAISTGTFADAMRVVVLGFFVIVIAFIGLILGIVGVSADERKVFAILGLVLCTITLIFIVLGIFSVRA